MLRPLKGGRDLYEKEEDQNWDLVSHRTDNDRAILGPTRHGSECNENARRDESENDL